MLEKECIQSRGFRNVTENGEVVGFQVAFRSLYYRGVWLSQLRPATLRVDGEPSAAIRSPGRSAEKRTSRQTWPSMAM